MKAWINNIEVQFEAGETILQVAKRNGIYIPSLCAFLPLDHTPGTCRVCLVETDCDGKRQIVTSCTTPMLEGMHVSTRSAKVRAMQRKQVSWIFADHDQDCASCARHADCELQDVAQAVGLRYNAVHGRFVAKRNLDTSANGLVCDQSKCIRCGRCVQVCRDVQGVSALTINDIGTSCSVGFGTAPDWASSTKCVQCGQCSLVCPTGALAEKDETETAIEWFDDPEIRTVVAFAPAVRVTLGELFGIEPGTNVEGQIIAAAKALGADYVCDVNWAADVTIMEEGTELLGRIRDGGTLPMMTSCCPGWINFVEKLHPEVRGNLSTTRSPQAIFGALAKTYFARNHGIDPRKLRFISIMPCTAKKDEAARKELSRDGMRDTDLVLTVREFASLLRGTGIDLAKMPQAQFDSPFLSENTGAAAIFGVTGGVMEAAVRTVHKIVTGKTLEGIDFMPARGMDWIKEASVDLGEAGTVRIAIVHGLKNVEPVLEQIRKGTSPYHFIEVMACPGGCIDGGGTARIKNDYMSRARVRSEGIYDIDRKRKLRQSHENPDVIRLYEEYLKEPNGELSHKLLHTHYSDCSTQCREQVINCLWERVKLG